MFRAVADAPDIEFEVALCPMDVIGRHCDRQVQARLAAGQRMLHRRDQLGRRYHAIHWRDLLRASAQHRSHHPVDRAHRVGGIDDCQAGRHAVNNLLQVQLVLQHFLSFGMEVSVQCHAHVQANHFRQRVAGAQEYLRLGLQALP